MATIPVAQLDRAGQSWTDFAGVAGPDTHTLPSNDGLVIVFIDNPTGGDLEATVITSATFAGQAFADDTVELPAWKETVLGPYPPAIYGTRVEIVVPAGATIRGLRI